jgi:hypothetical protein
MRFSFAEIPKELWLTDEDHIGTKIAKEKIDTSFNTTKFKRSYKIQCLQILVLYVHRYG